MKVLKPLDLNSNKIINLLDPASAQDAASKNYVDLTGLTGNLLFVDKVNGNDSTGLRGREDKSFLTLAAAKTAATSGDLIVVLPGTYNERDLLKDGVNWYFYPGATVAYDSGSGEFTFADGASTNASGTYTSATAAFTAADVGRSISGTNINDGTTIASVTNATTIALSSPAIATGSALSFTIHARVPAGGIFDDSATGANAAIACQILGEGTFICTSSTTSIAPGNAVLYLTNASSSVVFNGKYASATNSSTGWARVIAQENGTLTCKIVTIEHLGGGGGYPAQAIFWASGEHNTRADVIRTYDGSAPVANTVSSTAVNLGQTTSGQFYVRANLIENQHTNSGSSAILCRPSSDAVRNWIDAIQVKSASNVALDLDNSFFYLTSQKVTGQIIAQSSGILNAYLTIQKLAATNNVAMVTLPFKTGGGANAKNIIATINQFDDANLSAIEVVSVKSSQHKLILLDAAIARTTTGDALKATNGTLIAIGCNISGVASGFDLNRTGGTLTVIGCGYNASNTSGTITFGDPLVPASITGLRKGAGVGSLDTAAVDGADYLSPTTGMPMGEILAMQAGWAMP